MRGPAFDVHLHLSAFWPDPPHTFYRPDLDYTLTGLLREMDSVGVAAGLVLPEEHTPTVQESLREGEAHRRSSGGRLLKASTVDPTRGREEVERAVGLWEREPDLAALKLYPGYQHFYPWEARLEPLYEFAARTHRVVMVHQGDTLDPLALVKFARPIELDEVAVRYRDVRFVLCHFGNPWVEEAAEVVYKNPNVYVDTSGLFWSPRSRYYAPMIAHMRARISGAIAAIGDPDRVLYGSDWPLESLGTALEFVRSLALPPEDIERILGENARRLFARFLPDDAPPARAPRGAGSDRTGRRSGRTPPRRGRSVPRRRTPG